MIKVEKIGTNRRKWDQIRSNWIKLDQIQQFPQLVEFVVPQQLSQFFFLSIFEPFLTQFCVGNLKIRVRLPSPTNNLQSHFQTHFIQGVVHKVS